MNKNKNKNRKSEDTLSQHFYLRVFKMASDSFGSPQASPPVEKHAQQMLPGGAPGCEPLL